MNAKCFAIGVATIASVVPLAARAGAVLKIDDDTKLDLGLRLQTQFIYTENDRTGDGNYRANKEVLIRRARVRLRGDVTKYVQAGDLRVRAWSPSPPAQKQQWVCFPADSLWIF